MKNAILKAKPHSENGNKFRGKNAFLNSETQYSECRTVFWNSYVTLQSMLLLTNVNFRSRLGGLFMFSLAF